MTEFVLGQTIDQQSDFKNDKLHSLSTEKTNLWPYCPFDLHWLSSSSGNHLIRDYKGSVAHLSAFCCSGSGKLNKMEMLVRYQLTLKAL